MLIVFRNCFALNEFIPMKLIDHSFCCFNYYC